MHSLSLLVIFLAATKQASSESNVVFVTCGQPFTLHCSFNANGSCAWQRNASVVKTDGRRYSSKELKLANGTTNCSFHAAKAEIKSDFGHWTCGATANDDHDGTTFKNILVNVTRNGSTCTYFEDPPLTTKISEFDAPNSSNETLHIIIGTLSSVLFLFILVALMYYWKRARNVKNVKTPALSFHEYEEIDANYSSMPNTTSSQRCDSSTQPNCQEITLKIGNTETTIPITDIFNANGYEMPLSSEKTTLTKADSGATFKLIAVRQPAESSQRNSTQFHDGVQLTNFPNQAKRLKRLHDYQNIRPTN